MAKMGFCSILLLVLLTAHMSWCRPQQQQQRGKLREVKLITEPRPGQEFVHIQSSVISQQKQDGVVGPEVDFVTSHKIPRPLPVDEPEDIEIKKIPEAAVKSRFRTAQFAVKSKRESVEAPLKTIQTAILTPAELLPLAEEVQKTEEIRMEFSVVTSKPRKETKQAAGTKKASPLSAEEVKEVDTPEVEVDSKGEFGQLQASPNGADEKKVLAAKKQPSGIKLSTTKVQEQLVKEVEVKPASQVGVNLPIVEQESGAITVPIQKQQYDGAVLTTTPVTPTPSGKSYDILPVNHIAVKREGVDTEKDFDFVDSPLADKVLIPAGSNQQSRIEVKKGPNGQDYEYEYVYYYYDDDENDTTVDAGAKKTKTAQTSSTVTTSTSAPVTTTSRLYLPESPAQEVTDHARVRGRGRGQASHTIDLEQTNVATQDAVNEIVPARGGSHSRSRGRSGITTEEPSTVAAEERLPANTRFPPRSRSSHNSNSVATTTPLPASAAPDTPITRVRGGGSSVRRPSLELVDSSSFKTHSSDASRDQDLRPEFPSRLPEGPARFLGVSANDEEEPIKPRGNRLRGPSSSTPTTAAVQQDEVDDEEAEDEDIPDVPRRGQPSRRPTKTSNVDANIAEDVAVIGGVVDATTTSRTQEAGLSAAQMDIVANELYSLFQQAQAENTIVGEEATSLHGAQDDEDITTELEEVTTTQAPTTQPPTTTRTTAATTTSTTTQEPATTAGGRGRYRPRGNAAGSSSGSRNRFRGNSGSIDVTSTTTEAPVESSTRAKGRFGSNSRVPSSNNYGRKNLHKSTASPSEDHSGDSDPEVAVREVSTAAPAVRSGGFSRNRFSAARTTRITSTTSSPPSDESPPSSPSSPAKPAFADRFNNLRRRGGAKTSTTSAPAVDETRSDSSGEETNEPATPSEATSTTARPAGRTRLSIGSGARPLRPGPKVNIGSRGRLGATTTTTQQPSTEADDSEQTLSSSSSAQEDAQSQSDEAPEVVTTPVPDALTRLRNRPRLRVNAAVKQPASSTPSPVRRPLGLLPRRRLQPAETKETSDSDSSHPSEESESSSASSEETSEASSDGASSATREPQHENTRHSSLLSNRRTRPRTHFPARGRQNTQEEA